MSMRTPAIKKNGAVLLICALFGALCLALASKNSFLYSFNNSADVNCFVTTARCMMRGDVLYRDVYEHKGPIMYFIYIIGLKLTPGSFVGIYIIECLFFAAFGFFSFKTVKLYIRSSGLCMTITALSMLLISCSSHLSSGGQSEELALPFIAVTIWLAARYFRSGYPDNIKGTHILVIAICFTVLFWIKYTMTGFFAGLVAAVAVIQLRDKKVRELFVYAGWFLLGVLIASLPVIIYFSVNNAFDSLFEVYFYNLIFKYRPIRSSARFADIEILSENLAAVAVVPMLIICMCFADSKRVSLNEKIAAVFMIIAGCMGLSVGNQTTYALLPLWAFAPLGLAAVCMVLWDKHICSGDMLFGLADAVNSVSRAVIACDIRALVVILAAYIIVGSKMFVFMVLLLVGFIAAALAQRLGDAIFRKSGKTGGPLAVKYLVLAAADGFAFVSYEYSAYFVPFLIVTAVTLLNDCSLHKYGIRTYVSGKLSGFRAELEKERRKNTVVLAAVFTVVSAAVLYMSIDSRQEIMRPRSEYPQYKIAEYIKSSGIDDPAVICYNDLDQGVYWAADIYPPGKYFCSYCIKLDEIDEQNREYIQSRKADFVITTVQAELENYECVFHERAYYSMLGTDTDYFLYRCVPEELY